MVTAIVQFSLPANMKIDDIRRGFAAAAPQFRHPDGLLRKYFLLGEGGCSAGGVYLWASREQAERFYAAGFAQMIAKRYGTQPMITYFDTPVVVDNVSEEVVEV